MGRGWALVAAVIILIAASPLAGAPAVTDSANNETNESTGVVNGNATSTITISDISEGETETVRIGNEGIAIKTIGLSVDTDVPRDISITFTVLPLPWYLGENNDTLYQYIEAVYTNLTAGEIKEVVVYFDVNKSWVSENQFNKYHIYIAKHTDTWHELETSLTGEDDDAYHYKATSPVLYIFGIFAKSYCTYLNTKCEGAKLYECSPTSEWRYKKTCPYNCSDGACMAAPINETGDEGDDINVTEPEDETGNVTDETEPRNVTLVTEPGDNQTIQDFNITEYIISNDNLTADIRSGANVTIELRENITSKTRESWNPEGLKERVNATASITNIYRESPAVISVSRDEISLKSIEVAVKEDVERQVDITVTRIPEELPGDIGEITGVVYQYMEIEHGELANEEIENAILVFDVDKAWLEEKGIERSDVYLGRYSGGWEKLATEFLNETDGMYYYTATAPGLSMFAIFSEKIAVSMDVECVPMDVKCEGNTAYECSLDAAWELKTICSQACRDGECVQGNESSSGPGGKKVLNPWEAYHLVMLFIAVIIALAIVGAILGFRHKRSMAEIPKV